MATGSTDKIIKLDNNTIQIRDDFYKFSIAIPVNEFDYVYSFLRERMQNKTAADNFTAAVFQIAASRNETVQSILESFGNQNKLELTATIAMYLNEIRKPTTLLGVSVFVTPNLFASRNVLV
jgi:hypothetical protein